MHQLPRGFSTLFVSYCVVAAILLLLIHPASPALRDASGVRTVDSALLGRYTVTGFDVNLSGTETSRNTTWIARLDPDARVLDASLRVTGSPLFVSKTIPGWGTAQRNNEYYSWAIDGRADFNDDGMPDFVVSAPALSSGFSQGGRLDVFYGSSTGVMAITGPGWSYNGPGGRGLGNALTHGDYNDDGIDDLVAGENLINNGTSSVDETVYLFYGSASGLPSSPSATLVSANNTSFNRFGFALAGGVDIDADGYDDLVVGEPSYFTLTPPGCDPFNFSCSWDYVGRVHVFWGAPSGLDVNRVTTVELNTTYQYGLVLKALGDTDGDGQGEFAVGAPANGSGLGLVDVYEGISGSTALNLIASLTGTSYEYFGQSIAGGSDLTGDTVPDLLVGAPYKGGSHGAAYLLNGTGNGTYSSSPWATLTTPGASSDYFGYSLDIAGDVDGDSLQDVIVGAFYGNGSGAAYLYTNQNYSMGAEQKIASPYAAFTYPYFGYSVAGVGDFDLDGYDEYAVGAPYGTNGTRQPGSITLYPRTLHPFPEDLHVYVGAQPVWSLAVPLSGATKITGLGPAIDAYLQAHRGEIDITGRVRIPIAFNFSLGGLLNVSDLQIIYTVVLPPTDLTVAEATTHYALIVTWRAPPTPDVTLFTLWTNKTGAWERLDNFTAPSLQYFDFGLAPGESACYRVTAWDPDVGIESPPSAEACGTLHGRTPPSIPTNLTALGNPLARTALVSWDAGEPDLDHYELWRREGDAGNFLWLANVSAPASLHLDAGLQESTNYSYKVRAVDQRGLVSSFSLPALASIPDQTPPGAPTGLAGRSLTSGNAVDLTWAADTSDIDHFEIYLSSTSRAGPFVLIGSTPSMAYLAVGLRSSVTYHFYVIALDEADNPSDASAILSVLTIDYVAPRAPTGLTVSTHFVGHTLLLSWNPSGEEDLAAYKVYFLDPTVASDFTYLATVTAPETSFSHLGLRNGIVYAYYLTAVDTSGNESPQSNEEVGVPRREIPPDPPVLAAPEPLSKDSQVELEGTADHDLRVELWVNGEKQLTVEVDESGHFHAIVSLEGSDNTIYARVFDPSAVTSTENRLSAPSPTYHVWLDAEFPRVMRSEPYPGQIDADPQVPVIIWASERLDPSSAHFVLRDANGTAVTGTLEYDDSLERVVFTPAAPLDYSHTYTVQFSGADLAGNELTLHAYTFFTRSEPPPLTTTPPSTPGFEAAPAFAAAVLAAAAALWLRSRRSNSIPKNQEETP